MIHGKWTSWATLIFLAMASLSYAQKNTDSKDKKNATQATSALDASSFSISMNGRQVARETFHIDSRGGEATIHSELHYADGATKAEQTAELKVNSNGELKKYFWKETAPGSSLIDVEPQDQNFLTLRYVENGTDMSKAKDMTHPLSITTNILDDYFFSHIEVLAWRYMASICKLDEKGVSQCKMELQRFPAMNPHQQTSYLISIKMTGQDKCKWNNSDHHCVILNFKTESSEWTVWLDSADYKMLRLTTPEGLEVVRE